LNKRTLVAFFLHQGIGAITFVIDIAIILTLVYVADMRYPYAVAIGFVLATAACYLMSRSTIYANSKRPHSQALFYYFVIALILLSITVGGTVALTELVGFPFYVSKIIVGFFIAVSGFFVDCLVTFELHK
jgi:putative flippase GtrA